MIVTVRSDDNPYHSDSSLDELDVLCGSLHDLNIKKYIFHYDSNVSLSPKLYSNSDSQLFIE